MLEKRAVEGRGDPPFLFSIHKFVEKYNENPAGTTAAHIKLTRDGKYVLIRIWENDGAMLVYDAATLKEVKRLPMSKPSGKYNVYNKIMRSAGTSH
ncbi:MAG: cytochrome D1 domain-containing protein [Gallionella sp.]|nr:cytochrome D1 domain-containing protein [Gallionella sp.]